jgi:hypothetical protein
VGQFEVALKGHGFSRAVTAAKSMAALAAAGMLSFKLTHYQILRPRPENYQLLLKFYQRPKRATLIGRSRRECVGTCLFQRIFLVITLFTSIVSASAQAPSAPGQPLPPGPMQAKVKAACTQCHNTSRITEQHLTREQWTSELEKMEGLGAVISDADRKAILNYLTRNFGPEKGAAKPATKKSGSASE